MLRSPECETKINYKELCNCLGSTQFLLATSVKTTTTKKFDLWNRENK